MKAVWADLLRWLTAGTYAQILWQFSWIMIVWRWCNFKSYFYKSKSILTWVIEQNITVLTEIKSDIFIS